MSEWYKCGVCGEGFDSLNALVAHIHTHVRKPSAGVDCPILLALDRHPIKCIKEECAWWHRRYEQCAVVSMAEAFDWLLKRIDRGLGV